MKQIKPEDLLKFKFVSCPRVSPDGKSIVYVVTRVIKKKNKYTYASNLWMYDLENNRNYQFTYGNHRDFNPRWSSDSKFILFLSNREGEEKGMRLYIIPRNGGEAKKAIEFEGVIKYFEWAPKGHKFLFIGIPIDKKEKEKEHIHIKRLFYKLNGAGFLPQDKRAHVYIATPGRGKPQKITEGDFDVISAKWHPDGKKIGILANTEKDAEYVVDRFVYLVDIRTKKLTRITPRNRTTGAFDFSPDGKFIATLEVSSKKISWANPVLFLYNLKTGRRRNLLQKFDIDFGNSLNSDVRGGMGEFFHFGKKGIYFIAEYRGTANIFLTDLKGNLLPLTQGEHSVETFTLPRRENFIVYLKQDITDTPNIYIKKKSEEKLANFNNRVLRRLPLGKPQKFEFTASDGQVIDGWLLLPYDFDENKKYPMILEIHGGPQTGYGYSFMFEFHYLSSLGYVVAFTNPRGSSGYGSLFKKQILRKWGERDFRDIMEAVEFITSHYGFIDSRRLGVTGGSYGGFMTNWIVTQTDIFKAAVTQRSLTNFLSFTGTCDFAYYFAKFNFKKFPFDAPMVLLKNSPLMYVRNVKTPLLIIHSLEDHRCPVEQAEQFYVALKSLKKEVEMVLFRGENHDLSRSGKPHNRITRLKYISDWFDKYLKEEREKK